MTQLALSYPQSWADFLTPLAGQMGVTPDALTKLLLRLAAGVEGVLRQGEEAEARPRAKPQADEATGQGEPIRFADDDEPWPDPVDGAQLLDTLVKTFLHYLFLRPGGPEALALWTLYTHAHDIAPISPILALQSPHMRCGKTTTLQIVAAMASRSLPCSNITAAALIRTVSEYAPTLVLDEADTFLGGQHEDLRGVLNSGHTRATAFVIRNVGEDHEPRRFSTWCPKLIAFIGKLSSTLADRSITLPLQRKRGAEKVERVARWRATDAEQLSGLRQQCRGWADEHRERLATADPEMPAGLHDRAADNWRPLLAIADLAGGDWPQRAKVAITSLEVVERDEDELGVLLLSDLRDLFTKRKTDRLASADICEAFTALHDRPWPTIAKGKPINQHLLSRLLSPYDIVPGTIRIGDKSPKGYLLSACQDAFLRYLPPFETATSPHGSSGAPSEPKQNRNMKDGVADSQMPSKPPVARDVAMLRSETGETGPEKCERPCGGCRQPFSPLHDGASKTLCCVCQAELRRGLR
jgi:LSD1 subclass zinc finger protein